MPRTRRAAAAAIAGAFLPFEEKSAVMPAEAFGMAAAIRTAIAAAKLAPNAGVVTMARLKASTHYGMGDRLVLRAHDELSRLATVAGVESRRGSRTQSSGCVAYARSDARRCLVWDMIHDHIIVARTGNVSLRARGYLS